MISIRIAEVGDQTRLIDFIRDHWSSTHIFTSRPEVFAWQYLQDDGRLNMVFAEDDAGGVLGVLGFIPMGRFAPSLGDRDVMLAIWKVKDDGVPPGLGLRLLKYVESELRPRLIAAIGTSQMVRPLYKLLKYEVGSLRQSAVFHPDRAATLRIANGVPEDAFGSALPVADADLALAVVDQTAPPDLQAEVDRVAAAGTPAKSWDYIVERYLRHPWYDYDVRAVRRHDDVVAAVVWRTAEAKGSRVLRIVDIIGDTDWLRLARFALQNEIVGRDAEYLDILQLGIDGAVLNEAGFVSPADHPGMVLPNYFSPFEARNVEIELAYKVLDDSDAVVHLFRADSDQDRPNMASELAPSP